MSSTVPARPLRVDDADGVRLVTFDRPAARNAFDRALYLAVAEALDEARADDAIGCVVLTGTGTVFSSGQDLDEMAALATGDAPPEAAQGFRGLLDAVDRFDKPLLAAVNGHGVGLGFTLLAHCDLVLVADGARFRVPFAELGVPCEAGSSLLFPAAMGWQRAAEVLLTGTWVDAHELVASGLALRVCARDVVVAETLAVASRLAAAPRPAVRAIKSLMSAARADAVAAARAREDAAFAELLGSAANVAALAPRQASQESGTGD